jgi:hypothetical protein
MTAPQPLSVGHAFDPVMDTAGDVSIWKRAVIWECVVAPPSPSPMWTGTVTIKGMSGALEPRSRMSGALEPR